MPRASRTPVRRPNRFHAGPAAVLAALAVAVLAACTGGTLDGPTAAPTASTQPAVPEVRAEVVLPEAATTVVPGRSAAQTALAASRALFGSAPVAVLAAQDDPAHVGPAATAGVALGAPVLVVEPDGDDALAAELDRLGSTDVVVVGDAPASLPADLRVHVVDPTEPAAGLAALGIVSGAPQEVDAGGLTEAALALERPAPALLLAEAGPGGSPGASPSASSSASPSPRASDGAGETAAAGSAPWPVLTLGPADRSGTATSGTATSGTAASPAPSATRPSPGATPATGGPARLGDDGPVVLPPRSPERAAVLVDVAADTEGAAAAAVATARAAGLPVVDVPRGDPRETSATVAALTGVRTVVALGSSFGAPELLGARVAAAATGVELPGGGQLVFPDGDPGKRYVALYGTPGTPALGVLGEQDVPATIARAQQTAAPYADLTDDTVVPTLEIIATIASAGPEPDGSYSRPRSVDDLRPLVEAAGDAGMAVVIDLQPGRTDFVTQAQQFAELLEYPHVGLALDPEWRLAPDQVHLRQIGSVGIDEVNATADWLARFTRERHLPQKMFLLHQFSLRMITDRERLDTSHDELAMIIHADGQGSQPAKADTWRALHQGAPQVHWGWKNFYDEDSPMLDPAQTYAVQPTPDLVTYQ